MTAETAMTVSEPHANGRPAMSRDQIDLIRRTICPTASDDELKLFLMQCQRTGLDPFSRQIHAVMRKSKDQVTGLWVERLSIQVGIDGFRLVADRTGQTDGQDGPFWCGPDGVWRDVWLEQTPPAAAKITVYRKGQARGYVGVARFQEYVQQGPMWTKMPSTMLAKCAESLALRKAFPAELSGLYTPDESAESEPAQPQTPREKALATTEAARQERYGPKPEATPEPELAAEQMQLLRVLDDRLAAEGLCNKKAALTGAVLVARTMGFNNDSKTWTSEVWKAVWKAAEEQEKRLLLGELDRLFLLKGEDASGALLFLKAKPGTSLEMLPVADLRKCVGQLRPLPDVETAEA